MGPNRGLIERLLKQLTRCLPQASSKKNKKKEEKEAVENLKVEPSEIH